MTKEKSILPIFGVQDHLDRAGNTYLERINGSPDIMKARMSPLVDFLKSPNSIVSLGVGSGYELLVLRELFDRTRIIGLDLSPIALNAAKEKIDRFKVDNIKLIHGDVTSIPLPKKSVDGVVMSALLHEVYSYSPDGIEAWKKTIREVTRVLSPGGAVLLRDCKAPDMRNEVAMTFTSHLAEEFYEYFRLNFRTFSNWLPALRAQFQDRRMTDSKDFPNHQKGSPVILTIMNAAELLLHFRHFWHATQQERVAIGNDSWKEMQERYFPFSAEGTTMDIKEYIKKFLSEANIFLLGANNKMICARNAVSERPNTNLFLQEHFSLKFFSTSPEEKYTSQELISKVTQNMELIFVKSERK